MQGNFRRWYVTSHKLCSPDSPLQPRLRFVQRNCQGQQPRHKQREGRGTMRPTFNLAGPKRSHPTPPKSRLLVNHTIFLPTTPPHWKRRRRILCSQLYVPPTAHSYTNTSAGFHFFSYDSSPQGTTDDGASARCNQLTRRCHEYQLGLGIQRTRKNGSQHDATSAGSANSLKLHQLGCSTPSFEARCSAISQPHLTSTTVGCRRPSTFLA